MLNHYNVTKEDLVKWYLIEKKSYRWIMEKLGINNARAVKKMLTFCNIPIRIGSEAVKAQWINNDERRKNTSEKLKSIRPNIKLVHSNESKNKIGKANSGKNNGMYGCTGEKNPLWKGGKKNWKRGRKIEPKKRSELIKQLGNKCEKCGSVENLTIHHDPPWRICRSHDLKFLHCLCLKCHMSLHHQIR